MISKDSYMTGYSQSKQYLFAFIAFFINVEASLFFGFKRRLKFHGLAFGADYDYTLRELTLNIGYTSAPVMKLPACIEAVKQNRRSRRKLLFESPMLELISDLVFKLRNLRPVRIYYNPAKRSGRRGVRVYMTRVRRKKFKKDARFRQ
jgi:ribosomal protein L6P/L9E